MNNFFAFISGWEWIIVLAVIILLFGAKKIPDLARGLGRSISEFKKGKEEGGNTATENDAKEDAPKKS